MVNLTLNNELRDTERNQIWTEFLDTLFKYCSIITGAHTADRMTRFPFSPTI